MGDSRREMEVGSPVRIESVGAETKVPSDSGDWELAFRDLMTKARKGDESRGLPSFEI